MKTKTIQRPDGTKIVYDEFGDRQHQTLFLLHGNGGSARYFRPQITQYTQYFHVIAIDTRGHGRSSNTQRRITFDDMVADIEAIRQTEEIGTLYILGYSDGANIGIKYATLYPKRVTRLVLNAPNLSKKGVYQVLWWFDRTAQFLMRLLAPINHYAKRRYKQLHVMSEPLNISRRDLERISAPTLLVIGRFDLVKKRHIERIAAILPHAEVLIIPRGGHFVTYTNPKKFSALVLPFLQRGEEYEKV